MEVINEIFVYITTFHLLLFTDYIDNEELKSNIGWFMLASIFLLISLNLFVVAGFAF